MQWRRSSLMANPKVKDTDFKGNQWISSMNVGGVAWLLCGTIVKTINKICNNPKRYPMPEACPAGTDRVTLFSKIRQLSQHMIPVLMMVETIANLF
jgi:hypothetical protein